MIWFFIDGSVNFSTHMGFRVYFTVCPMEDLILINRFITQDSEAAGKYINMLGSAIMESCNMDFGSKQAVLH